MIHRSSPATQLHLASDPLQAASQTLPSLDIKRSHSFLLDLVRYCKYDSVWLSMTQYNTILHPCFLWWFTFDFSYLKNYFSWIIHKNAPHLQPSPASHLRLRAANAPQPPNIHGPVMPRPRKTKAPKRWDTKALVNRDCHSYIWYLFFHAFGWSNTEKTRLGRE